MQSTYFFIFNKFMKKNIRIYYVGTVFGEKCSNNKTTKQRPKQIKVSQHFPKAIVRGLVNSLESALFIVIFLKSKKEYVLNT